MGATLLLLSVVLFASTVEAIDSPVVRTKLGAVKGRLIQWPGATQDVYQFTGIPFAEPPVGNLRFKEPQPKRPWTQTLDATGVTKSCIQVLRTNVANTPMAPVMGLLMAKGINFTEDCLYLNVWVPRATLDAVANGESTPRLAVNVYIHGGGFFESTTMIDIHNGTVFSGFTNTIMVSMHYRLGSLGFAYFGKNNDAPGNAGLWDQLEAMKWVSENIEAFGGDPNLVTLTGESAGAASVSFHLLSPHSCRYFQKAIIQSGTAIANWATHEPNEGQAVTDALVTSLGRQCNPPASARSSPEAKLRCLRSIADPWAIATADGAVMGMGFSGPVPVIDGDFIPEDPQKMLEKGNFYYCPLIIGANYDEGPILLLANQKANDLLLSPNRTIGNLTFDDYKTLVEVTFNISSIVPSYPIDKQLFDSVTFAYWPCGDSNGFPSGQKVAPIASQIVGDYQLGCPTYTWAYAAAERMRSEGYGNQVWAYHLTEPPPKGLMPEWVGAFHSEDLIFVYGLPMAEAAHRMPFNISEGYTSLSKTMMNYWGNFMKNGDPNRAGTPEENRVDLRNWPPVLGDVCKRQVMKLTSTAPTINTSSVFCELKARQCFFWNNIFRPLRDKLRSEDNI